MIRRRLLDEKLGDCTFAAEARFRTWSFVSAADQHLYEGNTEQALRFLERADKALGLDDKLDVNHPEIAKDYGGDEELWKVRYRIRAAEEMIRKGETEKAQEAITGLDGFFFGHALARTGQCLAGLIDPSFGIA